MTKKELHAFHLARALNWAMRNEVLVQSIERIEHEDGVRYNVDFVPDQPTAYAVLGTGGIKIAQHLKYDDLVALHNIMTLAGGWGEFRRHTDAERWAMWVHPSCGILSEQQKEIVRTLQATIDMYKQTPLMTKSTDQRVSSVAAKQVGGYLNWGLQTRSKLLSIERPTPDPSGLKYAQVLNETRYDLTFASGVHPAYREETPRKGFTHTLQSLSDYHLVEAYNLLIDHGANAFFVLDVPLTNLWSVYIDSDQADVIKAVQKEFGSFNRYQVVKNLSRPEFMTFNEHLARHIRFLIGKMSNGDYRRIIIDPRILSGPPASLSFYKQGTCTDIVLYSGAIRTEFVLTDNDEILGDIDMENIWRVFHM